jgi:hypothetical protein
MEINTLSHFNVRELVKMIAQEYYKIAEEKETSLAEPIVTKSDKL